MAAKPALKPVPAQPAEEPVKAKKSKLVPIIVVATLISFAAGGAAWHFLAPHPAAGAAAQGAAKPVVKQPSFMTLETFTVNLAGAEHFLQLGVVLQLDSEKTQEDVKTVLPKIRNDILLLLSSKTAEDLDAPGGKQRLADEILAATRKPLDEEVRPSVQGVLFSSMVVQ